MQNKIKLFIYTIIGTSFPLLIRTTLFEYNIRNIRSPYATIYLHSLDIALLLLWLVLFWKAKRLPFSNKGNVDKLWISLFFLIFSQLLWSKYPLISWFWGVRFYLLISLFWYVSRFQYLANHLRFVIKGLLFGMLIQSIVVIVQFGLQKNIGLPIVVEPALSVNISGVAKIDILDNIFIRGYGTFPHPNILGFVGVLSLISLYAKSLGRKLSITMYLVTITISGLIDHYILTAIQALSTTILAGIQLLYGKLFTPMRIVSIILIIFLHILILLSFSKTALTLLLIVDLVYLTRLAQKPMFHVEQFQNKLQSLSRIIINAFSVAGIVFLWLLPYSQIIDTVSKRFLYLQDSIQMISSNLWFGVGLGQYVVNLSNNRELWQYEPVHNIFLLLWSEIGLIGLGLLIAVICMECYTYIYGHKKQR
jgi:hypothetical protein